MQYLMNVIDDRTGSATGDEMAAIDAFNDQMQADGNWVFAAGLAGPENSTVVDHRGSSALTVDGPFVETKEYVAGFWIVDADDLDAALDLARRGSHACNRRVEVRPILMP